MGFLSSAIRAVKCKVRPSRTTPVVSHSQPDAHLDKKRQLAHKARKAISKVFRSRPSKIHASHRPSDDLARPSPPAGAFLQRTSVDPGVGTVPWPSSPLKLSVPITARAAPNASLRLPPRDALRAPRGRIAPYGAKKTLLGELMRRQEGVGLVFLSMVVVGVDATAKFTAHALRETIVAKSTQQEGSSTTVVEREPSSQSSPSSTAGSPDSKSLLAQGIGAMLLFVQEQGPLTRQALDELPTLLGNALETRAQEDAALRRRLVSNLQEWTLDLEQAINDGTAAHRREVEATREFLGTGVMPTLERSWPLESDFLVVPDQQPPVEVTLEPEAPKGLGARIKEAAAKLASPLLGGESPSASAPAPNAVPATAPKPPAPVGPSADEGNKVVSGIMETVLQSRRDRVKDAVAAAAADGSSMPTGEAKRALAQALGDAERSAAKLDPLLGTASPSQPAQPGAVVGMAPFRVKDTPLGAITTKRADGQVSAPQRMAPPNLPPPSTPPPPASPKQVPVAAAAVPAAGSPAAPNALAAVGKGAATLGALVLPWLIITKAANNGGGEGGNGGSGGRGGGGGRGGNRGKGDDAPRKGNLVMRMLVLASCAVVGYVARDRLGGVQRVVAQVVALTVVMWARLMEDVEEDVEDRVQMALAYVQ